MTRQALRSDKMELTHPISPEGPHALVRRILSGRNADPDASAHPATSPAGVAGMLGLWHGDRWQRLLERRAGRPVHHHRRVAAAAAILAGRAARWGRQSHT